MISGSAHAAQSSNYFDVARSVPSRSLMPWIDRLDKAYRHLIQQQSKPTDTHPSLSERIQNLRGIAKPELPFYPSSSVHLLTIPLSVELRISSSFATELRPVFFQQKLALGQEPLDGIQAESRLEFQCRYSNCPSYGSVELAMTLNDLALVSRSENYRVRWTDIRAIEFYTGSGFNFFTKTARMFGAALRETPSDRTLWVELVNGGRIEFPHWHVMENLAEVEMLLRKLWALPRVFGTVVDASGIPVAGAEVRLHDGRGAVCTTGVTDAEGQYSLLIPRGIQSAVSARADDFAETIIAYDQAKQQRLPLRLVLSKLQPHGDAIDSMMQRKGQQIHRRIGINPAFARPLALILKFFCATVGYFVPFILLFSFLLMNKDDSSNFKMLNGALTPCTVIGFATAALGWRLANRIALKYLFAGYSQRKDNSPTDRDH
jgi:hypothetical protein